MKLSDISFPVYKLAKQKPNELDGVLFYLKSAIHNNTKCQVSQVIDDKNVLGDTLARRRLQIEKPYKLKCAIFFVGDLLKEAVKHQWFIDSQGTIFTLEKTKRIPLVYKKITNIIRDVGVAIIEVEDLPGRHMCLFPPMEDQKYAAFLRPTSRSYILYGFADKKYEDTYRKI